MGGRKGEGEREGEGAGEGPGQGGRGERSKGCVINPVTTVGN